MSSNEHTRGKPVRRRAVLAGAAAGAVSAAVPLRLAAGQGKTLKIGVNLPRSGLQAQFGQDSARGVELALADAAACDERRGDYGARKLYR